MEKPASFAAWLEAHAANESLTIFATVWSQARGVERRLSFAEFAHAVDARAEHLSALLPRRARLALLSKGSLDFFVTLVGAQRAGVTPVILNWRQPVATLGDLVRDVQAPVVAVGAPFLELGAEVARIAGARAVAIEMSGETCEPRRPRSPASDEAAVFFTSGSTGSRPKAVLHTNATLLWTAENFVFPTATMTTTLCFMPNFHVLMTFQNFLLPLVRGVGVSIHESPTETITARLLVEACAALEPTTIDTVPFIMAEWSTMTNGELAPLAECAAVRSGGAPLPAAVALRLVDAGVRVQIHYGQTEAPGMQLLTVRDAAPDELAIFQPPWPCVEVALDGGGEEGELLIRGCGGSSPGYLKSGVLDATSSKIDVNGWHRTGDVFRLVKTRAGIWGVSHVSRVDDLLLLSTGEQFNPVPIEAHMANFVASHETLRVTRLAVLGRERPSPFLVVELKPEAAKPQAAEQIIDQLWPGLEAINAEQVEYARIQRAHVVVLFGRDESEVLPHSAKGNVLRATAEKRLASRLTMAADDAKQAVWRDLKQRAESSGHGGDVEAYLAEKGAFAGVDSLGVASFARVKPALLEAERVGDNVKAWFITAIVMVHWYGTKTSIMKNIYGAERDGGFQAVSKAVQFIVSLATLSNGTIITTACVICVMFSVGLADGERDDNRRVRFGVREQTLIILIFFYKCVVYAEEMAAWNTQWSPPNLTWPPVPTNVLWFVYMLVYGRVATFALQRLRVPAVLQVVGAAALVILTNTVSDDTGTTCSYCGFHESLGSPGLENTLNFLFYHECAFVVESTIPADKTYPVVARPFGTGSYVFVSAEQRVTFLNTKHLAFFPTYLIGYYYGPRVLDLCRRLADRCCWPVLTFATLAYVLFALYEVLLFSWLTTGTPSFHLPSGPAPSLTGIPDWLWQPATSSTAPGLASYSPVWARPLYSLGQWACEYLVAFLCVAACVSLPWRAARCGAFLPFPRC